jgi:ribosomal protein S21
VVGVAPGDSIDSAYRRFIRDMMAHGTFWELERARYYVSKGEIERAKRRKIYKTKRKRARARRKLRGKQV